LPAGVGARFVRADLQIHTPIDKRFKLPAGVNAQMEADRHTIGRLYVEAAQRQGLSVLGITEHNDLTYYPYIRDAAVGTDVVVFPGVEFTVPPGLHVIALFEPTIDPATIWDCIVKMGLGTKEEVRYHPDGSPKLASKSLRDAAALIGETGGLLIAPHVCGNSGLLTLKGQCRIEAWRDAHILAADPGSGRRIEELSAFERGAFANTHDQCRRDHPIATIWTSDARSLDELGRFSTWIKLGTPTLEGLRQAFLDPGSRVRHLDEYAGVKYPRLVSVRWDGTGFLAGQEISFNENLNCLIGGKGAGKSAVIETLRFAFAIDPADDFKDQTRSLIRAVLPAGATVRVVLESGEPKTRYVVERLAGGYAPVVRDANGDILEDVQPSHLQLPAIFGQKEIYGIAQKRGDQLAVLDEFVGDAVERLDAAEGECLKELEKNATALESLFDDLEAIDERLKALPKLQEMKKRYEALGITEKLRRKTTFAANLEKLRRAQKKLTSFADQVKQLSTPRVASEYGDLPESEPLKPLLDEARSLVEATATDWRTAAQTVSAEATKRAARIGQLVAAATIEVAREDDACQGIVAELASAYPDVELDDYLALEGQIAELLPLRAERTERATGEKQVRAARKELLERLRKSRAERFKARHDTAQSISERLKDVLRIKVTFQGGVESVRGYLDSLRTGVQKKALDALVAHPDFSLPAFVAALEQGAERLVVAFDLSEANAKRIADAIGRRERFSLETFDLPDAIAIEFNVAPKGEPQYKPLAQLSVGQKSTAILLLLLLNDDRPFIVDQPEDDLDNRFIYEDIVKRLRASKEQRQFIVATHNANIPVLGDAEQIVVLSATSQATRVECCGSIDDPTVQQSVKNILEGGQQAFEMRRKKYGF